MDVLVRIDGPPLELSSWYGNSQLSPRGRLLISHDRERDTVVVRDLDSGRALADAGCHGHGRLRDQQVRPGARVWICDAANLGLVIDGVLEPLATKINCDGVQLADAHHGAGGLMVDALGKRMAMRYGLDGVVWGQIPE